METSRGCPYHCTFCAKDNFRNAYRKRPLPVILEELDGLIANGIEYVYFIDEIFLPNKELLEALVERPVIFGVQTRVDLWTKPMLDLLGRAGCVSIEAGVESISELGRNLLDKKSRLSTEEISERLVHARRTVPFVQANLLDAQVDDLDAVEAWRQHLIANQVWANKPVPLFPYPGSPDYARRWGRPDDHAWERAIDHYLANFDEFSDIQEARPRRLAELEARTRHAAH
jgi:B12-binding domain/radical SAM domain protein of rhizo-twelve system